VVISLYQINQPTLEKRYKTMAKVENIISNNGNSIPNQFIIYEDNGDITFQSYNSIICQIRDGALGYDKIVVFGSDWDYSTTTGKYRNKFLMDNGLSILATKKDVLEALERGHARKDEAIAVFLDTTM
jgi:hypothetical protein